MYELTLTHEEAKALFRSLQRPNKVDDWILPLQVVRQKLARVMDLDPQEVRS